MWIDDDLKSDTWTGYVNSASPNIDLGNATAGQVFRIRLEYHDISGGASLALRWAVGSGAMALVPGSALSPAYGLATSTTTDDSAPGDAAVNTSAIVPAMKSATCYSTPWLGIVTSSIVDPDHTALTTTDAFEPYGGTGYLRQLSQTLPGGNTTTNNTYYSETGSYASQVSGEQWSAV